MLQGCFVSCSHHLHNAISKTGFYSLILGAKLVSCCKILLAIFDISIWFQAQVYKAVHVPIIPGLA